MLENRITCDLGDGFLTGFLFLRLETRINPSFLRMFSML